MSVQIDRATLKAVLTELDPDAWTAAEALLRWGEREPGLCVRWTQTGDIGLVTGGKQLLRIWPIAGGKVEVRFETLRELDLRWDDDARVGDLATRFERIDGVKLTGSMRWPRTTLAPLADPERREAFLETFGDAIRSLELN